MGGGTPNSLTLDLEYGCFFLFNVKHLISWEPKGTPPMPPPHEIRPYLGTIKPFVSLNKALSGSFWSRQRLPWHHPHPGYLLQGDDGIVFFFGGGNNFIVHKDQVINPIRISWLHG